MLLPFKKITYITAATIAVISSVLLLFGVRQYLLHRHYQKVIEQSERVIFQFSTIRGHIAQALIEGENLPIKKIIDEVQGLNTDISEILGDVLIPNEYKLSFINQMDLSGIVLLLRSLESNPTQPKKLRELYHQTRLIGDRLENFDRIIVRHAQARLVGFQSIVIGSLALVVFLVICIILFFHRQLVEPMIYFLNQVREIETGRRREVALKQGCKEIRDLARSFTSLSISKIDTERLLSRYVRLFTAIDKAGEIMDRAKSENELYTGVCRALLSDEDYCLAWIGILEDPSSEHLVPVAADASTTMSNTECKECMSALLTDAEEKGLEHNPSLLSLRKKKPIVLRDILSDLPKGPFKNTPLAEGYACCAAIPIYWNGRINGVLNVYSTNRNSFSDAELKLLARMTRNLGKAVQQLGIKRKLEFTAYLYNQIVHGTRAVLIGLSNTGKILSFNQEAERITGFSRQEVIDRDWLQVLIPPEYHAIQSKALKAIANNSTAETDIELPILCKNGEEKLLQCHLFSTKIREDENASDIMLIGQDFTEHQGFKKQVQQLGLERDQIFTHVSQVVLILDKTGQILDANPAALQAINMDRNAVMGKNISSLLGIHAEKEGKSLLEQAIESGTHHSIELQLGPQKKIYIAKIFPMNSQSKKDERVLLVAEDISEEKFRKAMAIRTCRLASIGELAAGIAHEINNPVNGMINYAQIVLDQALEENRDPEEINLVRRIINEGERIAEIVTRLLQFSRDQSPKKVLTTITETIEQSLALVNHQLRMDGIEVKVNLPEDLPRIKANPQQLQQVFLNIFNNARQALNIRYPGKDRNKRMEIRGEVVRKDEEESLKIYVVDWGVGIDPEVLDRIFEPFFTTKPPEEGTGLGLCISRQLIRDNGGEIHVESVLNDHTTVVIELPVSAPVKK